MSNNFSKDQFLKPLSILNPKPVFSTSSEILVKDAIDILQNKRFGSLVIVENEKLHAIITERDFLFKMGVNFESTLAHQIVEYSTLKPYCLSLSNTVEDCLSLISGMGFRHIPILNDETNEIYMVSINDVLKYISDHFKDILSSFGTIIASSSNRVFVGESNVLESAPEEESYLSSSLFSCGLSRVVSNKFLTFDIEGRLFDLIEIMQKEKYSVAIIVEYETNVKGIITERDILLNIFNKVDLSSSRPDILVKDYMTKDPHCLFEHHTVAHAINNMFKYRYRNIILIDNDKFPLAVISLSDILLFLIRGLDLKENLDKLKLTFKTDSIKE